MTCPQGPPVGPASVRERTPQTTAIADAASAWTARFARTLKNCRLYESGNPAVLRLREELATSLAQLLDEHGPLTLRCTSHDVLCGETSLYPARSRDDNLGIVFFRDGIRGIVFSPGIPRCEVDAFLDAVLRVTGRAAEDEDLVTLLWDADLGHVAIESVTVEAPLEDGEGPAADGAGGSAPMPWPAAGSEARPAAGPAAPCGDGEPGGGTQRSDDWITDEPFVLSEMALAELEGIGPIEMARLRGEHQAEVAGDLLAGALALAGECLQVEAGADEGDELQAFLAQQAREAIVSGAWPEARRALELLAAQPGGSDAVAGLLGELSEPGSLITAAATRAVDRQDARGVQAFLALARDLGPAAADWLMRVLAASERQRTRLPLARTLAEILRGEPERLAAWLPDPRWYVVRNVVYILGWIGGGAIVGLLQTVAGHDDPRVRREVLAALAHVGQRESRDVLLAMLDGAETRTFCSALHLLSSARDPEVAGLLLDRLLDARFHERAPEERRAIYSALARVAGEEILPRLETELYEVRRFQSDQEVHRLAVARCIARIGGTRGYEVLQRGIHSGNRRVRAVCESALAGARSHG